MANGGTFVEPSGIAIREINAKMAEKEYPPELAKRILDLADFVFNTYQKFAAVKPSQLP